MQELPDYYATLGVLPDAEDIVVRAAYRALAQRYHPDRCAADADAHRRMCELNEAFAVLSDPLRRRAYDGARRAAPPGDPAKADPCDVPPAGEDPTAHDWGVAVRYCPDLEMLEARLARFSWRLACAYRACVLETRCFAGRARLAALLEEHFLASHFGLQPRNIAFARNLIVGGEHAAARALNEAIRVFGADADPGFFHSRIAHEHGVWQCSIDRERLRTLVESLRRDPRADEWVLLLRELGGWCELPPPAASARRAAPAAPGRVEFADSSLSFTTLRAFRDWCRDQLLPLARGLVA